MGSGLAPDGTRGAAKLKDPQMPLTLQLCRTTLGLAGHWPAGHWPIAAEPSETSWSQGELGHAR